MKLSNYWKHFKTIVKHKYYVFIACSKCGITWRGIKHDMSKFSPKEFISSSRYFQGTSSPINAEKIKNGYSIAWQNHKGRNTHHYHYWIDVEDGEVIALKMPYKDVVEMICDWVGAGKAYNTNKWTESDVLDYFIKHRSKMLFHEDTAYFIYRILYKIEESPDGLKDVYKLLRKHNSYF